MIFHQKQQRHAIRFHFLFHVNRTVDAQFGDVTKTGQFGPVMEFLGPIQTTWNFGLHSKRSECFGDSRKDKKSHKISAPMVHKNVTRWIRPDPEMSENLLCQKQAKMGRFSRKGSISTRTALTVFEHMWQITRLHLVQNNTRFTKTICSKIDRAN